MRRIIWLLAWRWYEVAEGATDLLPGTEEFQ